MENSTNKADEEMAPMDDFDFHEVMDHLSRENWENMVRDEEEYYQRYWARRRAEELNPHSDLPFSF